MAFLMSRKFARFARKSEIADRELCTAGKAVVAGHADADLGGGVFKQRVARRGAGRSGGFRLILLFKPGSHVFFVHGFAKSDQANLTRSELTVYRKLAELMLRYSNPEVVAAQQNGALIEVICNDEDEAAG